jgi:hypothetical protein
MISTAAHEVASRRVGRACRALQIGSMLHPRAACCGEFLVSYCSGSVGSRRSSISSCGRKYSKPLNRFCLCYRMRVESVRLLVRTGRCHPAAFLRVAAWHCKRLGSRPRDRADQSARQATGNPRFSLRGAISRRRRLPVVRQYSGPCESLRKRTRRGRHVRPSDDIDDSIAHESRLRTVYGDLAAGPMVSRCPRSQRQHGRIEFLPVRREANCNRNCPAGPGRCVFACLSGRARDLGRGVRHETRVGANEANRHAASAWRRTTHRVTTALAGTTGQRRRRLRRRHPHPRTSAAS